jgi:hypothetical protein
MLKIVFFLILSFFIHFDFFSQEKVAICGPVFNPSPSNECDLFKSKIVDVENPSAAVPQRGNYNIDLVFDSFSKYTGGITVYGGSILKLIIEDNTSSGGTCFWKLNMTASNGGLVPSGEWNTITSYGSGSSAPKPQINILNLMIDNACHTAFDPDTGNPDNWRTPFSQHNQTRAIIDPAVNTNLTTGAGCSASEANGIGTYLGLDYNDMTFSVDYRITPGLNLAPGKYSLTITYCLSEK